MKILLLVCILIGISSVALTHKIPHISKEKLGQILPKAVTKFILKLKIQSNFWTTKSNPKADDDDCGTALFALINGQDPQTLMNFIMYSFKNLNDVGDFTSCVKSPSNRYVLLMAKISDGTPSSGNFGICGPKQCHAEDYSEYLKPLIMEFLKYLMKELELPDSGYFGLTDDAVRFIDVVEKNKELGTISNLGIALFSFLGFLLVAGIVLTYVDYRLTNGKFSGKTGYPAVECCSLARNARWIFYSRNPVDPYLEILNGMRVLSMCWVICGHTFDYFNVSPISNVFDITDSIEQNYWLQTIIAGTFSIDVFFFMSGFLCALTMTAQFAKIQGTGNLVKAVLISYAHRYIRLLPLYLLAILGSIAITPYVYSDGPLAVFNEWQQQICANKWWHNLLYIQNFTKIGEGCLIWSWYLANDMQFFLITPLLIILFNKKKDICLYAIGCVCCVSVISQIFVVWHYDLSVSYFYPAKGELFEDYYVRPYCRINAYLLGIVMAWAYLSWKRPEDKDSKVNMYIRKWVDSKLAVYSLMALGIAITYGCVALQYVFNHYWEDIRTWHNVVYIIISRPIFVVGVLLAVYPAILGKEPIMYKILGAPFWNPLAKLTYGAYMFHVILVISEKSGEYHSTYYVIMRVVFFAIHIWVLSYLLSLVLTLFFEVPVAQLEKLYLFPTRREEVNKLGKLKPKEGETTEEKPLKPTDGADNEKLLKITTGEGEAKKEA